MYVYFRFQTKQFLLPWAAKLWLCYGPPNHLDSNVTTYQPTSSIWPVLACNVPSFSSSSDLRAASLPRRLRSATMPDLTRTRQRDDALILIKCIQTPQKQVVPLVHSSYQPNTCLIRYNLGVGGCSAFLLDDTGTATAITVKQRVPCIYLLAPL